MKTWFPVLLACMISLRAQAQKLVEQESMEKESSLTVGSFTAQFMLSTDMKSMYLNIVGAGMRYSRGNKSISVTLFPSLSFREDKNQEPGEKKKPFVRPGFALGPLFQYKRVLIGFPAFYQDDAWHFTVGCGLRLGKL